MAADRSDEGAERRAGSRVRRAARSALPHWPFLLLLVLAIVLRVLAWSAYRPAILILGDTTAYLSGAVGDHNQGVWHPLFYSLFLKPAIAMGSLSVATAVQHGLVLLAGTGLYALLVRLRVHPILAALGTAPFLLDSYQLNLEQHILTEALFEFLIVAGVLLVAWWVRAAWWVYAIAGLVVSLSVGTRFAGLAMLPVMLIYFLVRRSGWLAPVALLGGFAVGLFGYLSWQNSVTGTFALGSRSGHVLYGKVATFADCTGVEMPEVERQLCIDVPVEERAPSYNRWNKSSPLRTMEVPPGVDPVAVTGSFSRRFIKRQPLDYARLVAADFFRFFAWRSPSEQEPIRVKRWQFFRHHDDATGVAPIFRETGGSPPPKLGLDEVFVVDRAKAEALISYQERVYPSGPLMTLMALLAIAGCVLKGRHASERDARPEALLFLLGGCALLLFPATFAAYHYRYVVPALPLLGPAAALGAAALIHQVGRRGAGNHDEVTRSVAGTDVAVTAQTD